MNYRTASTAGCAVLDSWAVERMAQLEARHMVSQVRALGQVQGFLQNFSLPQEALQ